MTTHVCHFLALLDIPSATKVEIYNLLGLLSMRSVTLFRIIIDQIETIGIDVLAKDLEQNDPPLQVYTCFVFTID